MDKENVKKPALLLPFKAASSQSKPSHQSVVCKKSNSEVSDISSESRPAM